MGLPGYLKLHRKMVEWEWYTDMPVKALFIHCLIKANRFPFQWRGVEYSPGQFITSYDRLKAETGLSVQQIRTALKKLISTNEITRSATKKYTVITVVNWGIYQGGEEKSTNETTYSATSNQQQNNSKITFNQQQLKNIRNKELNNITPLNPPKGKQADMFEQFWAAYPKKRNKGNAEKAWMKLGINSEQLAVILEAVRRAKTSYDWQKDNGQYIPYPATWLNAKGWLDETFSQKPKVDNSALEYTQRQYDASELEGLIDEL